MIIQNLFIETDYIYEDDIAIGVNRKHVAIEVDEGKIYKIHDAPFYGDHDEIYDGQGQLVLPLLYNVHECIDCKENSPRIRFLNREDHLEKKEINQIETIIKNHSRNIEIQLETYPLYEINKLGIHKDTMKLVVHLGETYSKVDSNEDYSEVLNFAFRLAYDYALGLDISLHDNDAVAKESIAEIIRLTKAFDMYECVTLCHLFGLSDFDEVELVRIFEDMIEYKMTIITTAPIFQPPVELFREMGGNLYLRVYDDCGRNDLVGCMREKLALYIAQNEVDGYVNLSTALSMVTWGIQPIRNNELAWPKVSDEASFLLTQSKSSHDFVKRHLPINNIIYKGKVKKNRY